MRTIERMETKDNDRGQGQARAQLDSIKKMMKVLRRAKTDEVRTGGGFAAIWHTPGTKATPARKGYMILLCFGGPAVRITGDLNEYGDPETAQLEYWFTVWERYNTTDKEDEILLEYARFLLRGGINHV